MANARKIAAADAAASVPTRGSINKQYNQEIANTRGFTSALVGLLRGVNPAAGYQQAVGSQQGIDAAAAARLAALGSPYAAGSAAAVQGLGDTSMSHLLANQGAAAEYGARQPGIATARGALGVNTLNQARNTALDQRNQAYAQNFQQALQAARAFGLQKQQFGESKREFNVQAQQQAAAAAESRREFNVSNAYRYAALAASGAGAASSSSAGGAIAKALGLTPSELSGKLTDAVKLLAGTTPETARVPKYGIVNGKRQIIGYTTTRVGGTGNPSALQAGVLFPDAIKTLIQNGVDPHIAIFAAARVYRNGRRESPYAWRSFAEWMAQHGNTKYRRIIRRMDRPNAGSSVPRAGH